MFTYYIFLRNLSARCKSRDENIFFTPLIIYTHDARVMIDFLLSLVLVALNIYILVYLFRLESIGCECAMDFRRTYAIAYLIVSIVYSLVVAVLMHVFNRPETIVPAGSKVPGVTLGVISLVMLIAGVLYVIFGVQYITRLRDEKCECSQDLARDVWQVVLYIKIAFYILTALLIVITLSAFGFKGTRAALTDASVPAFTNVSALPPSSSTKQKAVSSSRRAAATSSRSTRSQ